ncbi:MAG: chorismate synthase [Clostridia bacterium]|nr:chorismate synthase [Clostridia bacterium]
MKNTFGSVLTVTVFGESHGPAVGAVIDGLAPGLPVNGKSIEKALLYRRPFGDISTSRIEKDDYSVISGVYNGFTQGTPLCIIIPNKDIKSESYKRISGLARPGHADLTAFYKYNGFSDPNGGGHFSGRITAALCAAGAIVTDALRVKGIRIATHILRCAGIDDRDFENFSKDIEDLENKRFAVLDDKAAAEMTESIKCAAAAGDSVGGVLETVIHGIPAGAGEPFFDSAESVISHAMFSIGGVKGVEFGAGFAAADMRGSVCNDEFRAENGRIYTTTNNNGGINGGITNGMPIVFRCAVKPTPSVSVEQKTVDIKSKENAVISVNGRHDPCIVHRVRAVVDALTAFCIADMLCIKYGTDYLAKENI